MQTQFVALLPRTLIRFYVRLLNIWRSTLALIRTNSPGICTRQLGHWCPVYTDVCVGAGDVSPIFFNELMMHSCAHHNCSYIRCTRKIRKLCWIYLFRRDKLRCNIDYYYRKKKPWTHWSILLVLSKQFVLSELRINMSIFTIKNKPIQWLCIQFPQSLSHSAIYFASKSHSSIFNS